MTRPDRHHFAFTEDGLAFCLRLTRERRASGSTTRVYETQLTRMTRVYTFEETVAARPTRAERGCFLAGGR
jgi:hypothetical protein